MLDETGMETHREDDEFVPLLELLRQQKEELVAIHNSTSWRMTAPLRRFLDLIRGRNKS